MAKLTQRLGFTRYEADEHYQQALDAYGKRRYDDAHESISKAIELLPTKAEYFAARGFFHLEESEIKEAQEDFEQALKRNRYEMLAHYGRGIIAFQDKNWDEALAHFKSAHLADQNRGEPLYYLALTQHRKGENAAAVPFMEGAILRFEQVGDKRRSAANSWLKVFEKLVKESEDVKAPAAKVLAGTSPAQLQLPSGDDEDEEEA